jgi:hypothetical protein
MSYDIVRVRRRVLRMAEKTIKSILAYLHVMSILASKMWRVHTVHLFEDPLGHSSEQEYGAHKGTHQRLLTCIPYRTLNVHD